MDHNKNNGARNLNPSTLPPASGLVRRELQRRLSQMPLPELVALLTPLPPPPRMPAEAETPTVRNLIRRVLGKNARRSQEVVSAVQELRPGTPGPTVRSDLSRMRREGILQAVGPVRGGKLRIAK